MAAIYNLHNWKIIIAINLSIVKSTVICEPHASNMSGSQIEHMSGKLKQGCNWNVGYHYEKLTDSLSFI